MNDSIVASEEAAREGVGSVPRSMLSLTPPRAWKPGNCLRSVDKVVRGEADMTLLGDCVDHRLVVAQHFYLKIAA